MKSLKNLYQYLTSPVIYKLAPAFLTGFIDGIIIPLSVYCFFIRVLQQQSSALQITLITGIGLAILLAAGAYLTHKNETGKGVDSKLVDIYSALDIDENVLGQMRLDIKEENTKWRHEWNQTNNVPTGLSPSNYAALVGSGYIYGLLIVLLSGYITSIHNFWFLVFPLLALLVAAFFKYVLSRQNIIVGMITVMITGAVAAISNWLIAGLF